MSKLTGIGLADLHIGALPMTMHIKELMWLLDYIEHMENLDFLFIAGDTFDIKEYASSDVFRSVLDFIYALVDIALKFKAHIWIIEGTRGHDGLQIGTLKRIFRHLTDEGLSQYENVHFYINAFADTFQVERTGDKLDVLFLPEEYMVKPEEYYKPYFSSHYDFIIGHGMTDAVWYAKKHQDKGHQAAPVFPLSELTSHANYTFFGHIHQHIEKERFQYIGAFSRWEHGPNDAGFDVIEYDTETGICIPTYIENPNAAKMVTIARNYKEDKLNATEVVDDIRNALKDDTISTAYKIRLIVNFGPNVTNAKSIREYIVGVIDTMPNVTLICKYGDEPDDDSPENNADSFQLDEYQTMTERDDLSVQEYIKKNRDTTIPLETIQEVMGFTLKEDDKDGEAAPISDDR